jgi:tetratricopeptide (TPR) repeat protein
VQKAGEQVHINVQLIEAASDKHLWAQSYDRDIKDIFAVEREVAQTIADALKAQLTPQESAQVATVPTSNPAAYDLYLRALVHFNRAHDQDVLVATEIPLAIELFEQALATDPGFALAAAMRSNSDMRMYYYAPDRSQARLDSAKAAAERALALRPGLGEAHLALAMYHYWGHRDYAAATEQLRSARQELPNSADVETQAAAIARRQGRWDEAIAGFQKATLLDPRSSFGLDQLGLSYQGLRRYEEADRAFEQSVTIAPDVLDERVTHATNAMLWKGEPAPLRAAVSLLVPGSGAESGNASNAWWLAWLSRDLAAANKTVTSDTAAAWFDISNIALPRELYLAWTHEARGDRARAGQAFSRVQKSALAELSQRPENAELHLALGLADAGLGLKDEALREGRRAVELLPTSRDVLTGGGVLMRLAQIETGAGDHDAAFEHLRQLLKLPSGGYFSPATLKLDPIWDPLRKDPRFAELVALGEGPVVAKP